MSQVAISGNASGTGVFTIAAPNSNVSYTSTLPAATGTLVNTTAAVSAAGQIPFSTDGSTYTATAKIVSGTAVATTSGTAVDFTSIPSWVKRITVILDSLSDSVGNNPRIQLGTSGGVETTGYTGIAMSNAASGTAGTSLSAGFEFRNVVGATASITGAAVFNLISGNKWVGSGVATDATYSMTTTCVKTLSGVLDRIRITIASGNFDAGSVNILYE